MPKVKTNNWKRIKSDYDRPTKNKRQLYDFLFPVNEDNNRWMLCGATWPEVWGYGELPEVIYWRYSEKMPRG